MLKGLGDMVCVLQASTCAQAFAAAQAHDDLDLVLLDYHLPDMTGLDALQIFGQRHPELPIVMLSGSVNIPIMRQVVRSGAAGFVTKSSLSDELLRAIQQVLDGGVYIPPELETPQAPETPHGLHEKPALTQRQELVLRGLLDGRSNREISEMLNISDETVKSHVTAILRHFSVQNRTQAVVAAARRGYRGTAND